MILPHPTTQLQAVATLAATRAGQHVMANLHRRLDANMVARDDIKHKLDVEAQEVALATIAAAFPHHAILAEESEHDALDHDTCTWIVDPIDGTVNFFHGLPIWCCSVAVQYQRQILVGAVVVPEMQLTFEATCDGPARCNGRTIQVSQTTDLKMAMLATGADRSTPGPYTFAFMRQVAEIAQRPRILGAAALDICLVASGKLDGYVETGIYLWDVAAASLILQRAGGTFEVLKQYPNYRMSVIATNGQIHDQCRSQIMPLFNEVFATT